MFEGKSLPVKVVGAIQCRITSKLYINPILRKCLTALLESKDVSAHNFSGYRGHKPDRRRYTYIEKGVQYEMSGWGRPPSILELRAAWAQYDDYSPIINLPTP